MDYEIVLTGTSTTENFVQQVSEVLRCIYDDAGVDEYKKRWIEHDFPTEKFRLLMQS